MAYGYLILAITMEIIATTMLKMSEGFSKMLPAAACLAAYIVCYIAFAKALTDIQLGVAYATWCSIGIVATSVLAFLFFGEKLSVAGIIGIILIIAGCLLLNLFGTRN